MSEAETRGEDPLKRPVHAREGDKPFGRFTVGDVEAQAVDLAAVSGWGPTARVGAVARGWRELARVMRAAGARTVADLEPELASEFARRLWVVPPGGSLL